MAASRTPPKGGRRTIVRRSPFPQSVSVPLTTPLAPAVAHASGSADELDDQYDGKVQGYTYARERHANADVLAEKLDWLEGGEGGLVTASGMAAISAVFLGLLDKGHHVVAGDQLYGRSLRMLGQDLPRMGIETGFADATNARSLAAAVRDNTRIILVETLSNPTLRVADIEGIARLARERGALLVVDNTFATPALLRPFDHGADIVVHSITKFLAGHSDVTLGYVVARDAAHREAMMQAAVTWGLAPSPFDCWLAERGLHSFDIRIDKAEGGAAAIAKALARASGVKQVIYPGHKDHPEHNRAKKLFGGRFGNMVSFEIDGGRREANRFIKAAGGIAFAPTLGDVATTLSHPASSSHRALTPKERGALGIGEGFFRLSVGIEDEGLLIEELGRGLAAANGGVMAKR